MDDLLAALLLGVIEGITEFLPISSTGHLLIAQHWLGPRPDYFNIAIQSGAILAVCLIYRERLRNLVFGLHQPAQRSYALKIAAAFGVTAVLGLIVKKAGWQLPDTVTPVAWALIIGGVWILLAERLAERRPGGSEVTWLVAILVGLAQVVAGVFPGTSRSAATIFVAMLAGTRNRSEATEFAFLVGIPTMFAATAYELLRALGQDGVGDDADALVLAFLAACVTGFLAVRFLLGYIRHHRFTGFAVYRIALGAALLLGLPAGS